jgi:uncharacterized protein (DUF1810 family)
MDDPYYLLRFVIAQNRDGTYDRAVEELRLGYKRSHWMWFVFPQIAGLGHSATSKQYAISSLREARAYLEHDVLGPRLIECTDLVATTPGGNAEDIFGELDALKLRSSMTLFMRAAPDQQLFRRVIDDYFEGRPDSATDQRI